MILARLIFAALGAYVLIRSAKLIAKAQEEWPYHDRFDELFAPMMVVAGMALLAAAVLPDL